MKKKNIYKLTDLGMTMTFLKNKRAKIDPDDHPHLSANFRNKIKIGNKFEFDFFKNDV